MDVTPLLNDFAIASASAAPEHLGAGLIHDAWKVQAGESAYVLQRINTTVFRQPEALENNLDQLTRHFSKEAGSPVFLPPIRSRSGSIHVTTDAGMWRLFPYVEDCASVSTAQDPNQAFETARLFGRFVRELATLPASALQPSLPGFHDLPLRFRQFETALQQGIPNRLREAAELIYFLQQQQHLVSTVQSRIRCGAWPRRIYHHDAKTGNVLLDAKGVGRYVIDYDTVMPGYVYSDAGDLLRTCLCPVGEEETRFEAIEARADYFRAVIEGYLPELKGILTTAEQADLLLSGEIMIYLQSLRFLTDFLQGDAYYGSRYPGHNRVRAQNQATLLQRLQEVKPDWERWLPA
ncbi:MAG TPA: aminoglycoside phosphotransferase family protein [Lacibacter sp.]|nr:aminoglycoside phosphotransferase family protein [Lacibacter sp.]